MNSQILKIKTSCLLLGLAAFAPGCISTEKTEYRDVDRMKVEFENDTAGKQFYEALARLQRSRNRSESNTHVSLPILFEHKHRVVEGDNIGFNDAVRQCDTNADGTITEQEARIFNESVLGTH